VEGVGQFDRFILFDEDETLTNTNDSYILSRSGYFTAREKPGERSVSWKIAQPITSIRLSAARSPRTRNVFQALIRSRPSHSRMNPPLFSDQ
jgi:hypothetical protein